MEKFGGDTMTLGNRIVKKILGKPKKDRKSKDGWSEDFDGLYYPKKTPEELMADAQQSQDI
jgi:hypothetical protein